MMTGVNELNNLTWVRYSGKCRTAIEDDVVEQRKSGSIRSRWRRKPPAMLGKLTGIMQKFHAPFFGRNIEIRSAFRCAELGKCYE